MARKTSTKKLARIAQLDGLKSSYITVNGDSIGLTARTLLDKLDVIQTMYNDELDFNLIDMHDVCITAANLTVEELEAVTQEWRNNINDIKREQYIFNNYIDDIRAHLKGRAHIKAR
jgi:hypothetical protein